MESKSLWYVDTGNWEDTLIRINMRTLSIEYAQKFIDPDNIRIIMNLPNNKIFGFKIEEDLHHLFILDENLITKIIETKLHKHRTAYLHIQSCFYDNSIYTSKATLNASVFNINDYERCSKRYLIQENKWETLAHPPKYTKECIWFKQKIIFIGDKFSGIWLYDILIDSWTHHLPFKCDNEIKGNILIMHTEKLYFIVFSGLNGIYSCDYPYWIEILFILFKIIYQDLSLFMTLIFLDAMKHQIITLKIQKYINST